MVEDPGLHYKQIIYYLFLWTKCGNCLDCKVALSTVIGISFTQ